MEASPGEAQRSLPENIPGRGKKPQPTIMIKKGKNETEGIFHSLVKDASTFISTVVLQSAGEMHTHPVHGRNQLSG